MKTKYFLRNTLIAALIFIPFLTFGQTAKLDSIWTPLKFMLGSWTGKGGGEPGQGNFERSYNFIFGHRFIEVKNKSVYPPSKDYPEGEVHEDLGYISFDKLRNTFELAPPNKEFEVYSKVTLHKTD